MSTFDEQYAEFQAEDAAAAAIKVAADKAAEDADDRRFLRLWMQTVIDLDSPAGLIERSAAAKERLQRLANRINNQIPVDQDKLDQVVALRDKVKAALIADWS